VKSFFFSRGAEPAVSHNEKLKAFEALAFEHTDNIYRAAWHMTRNRLDAEDLMQEVYLRAFRFFDYFQSGTNFKAWLFTILRNTYINHYHEIAEIMHCPVGTVMSRLSRARRQLQRYLKDYAHREGYIGRTPRRRPESTHAIG
jgi:DNA-directed RNA polymerase specialized sigma24 family protein